MMEGICVFMNENTPLTPQEVANILKISKSTVYELIRKKEINSYRVGKKLRIDIQDVENYKNKSKDIKPVNINPIEGSLTLISPATTSESPNNKFGSFVICGQDVIVDILCRFLDQHPKGVRALRSFEGSYNGLLALYRGEVQVATAHIWDGKTGEYNVPFVEKLLPGIPCIIINAAYRKQGFYVPKGNPKEIKGWEDLKRSDISIVNRERGSGTRILLDYNLHRMGIMGNTISGYNRECPSHLAVASTVARGGADVGIGNEKACLQVQGIDFIPLQKEQYDLVIKKEDLRWPPFEAILDIIRSKEFKMELSGIGGYDLTDTGKVIAET